MHDIIWHFNDAYFMKFNFGQMKKWQSKFSRTANKDTDYHLGTASFE